MLRRPLFNFHKFIILNFCLQCIARQQLRLSQDHLVNSPVSGYENQCDFWSCRAQDEKGEEKEKQRKEKLNLYSQRIPGQQGCSETAPHRGDQYGMSRTPGRTFFSSFGSDRVQIENSHSCSRNRKHSSPESWKK